MAAFLQAWRDQHPYAWRIGFWYALGAVSLTVLWLAAAGLAPDVGLTRTYLYPLDAPAEPIVEERVTAIDLSFIDEQDRPTLQYRVRWQGVWFSPQAERIDFHAEADDSVILRVDGETILERSPAVGMHTMVQTIDLAAGAHRLEIDHWQRDGARSLSVQWAPAGDASTPLSPARLFPEDPGAVGYWLRIAAGRLPAPVLLVWAVGFAALVAGATYRRIGNLAPDEFWYRLRTVLFPAALGPLQLLLFGPWTLQNTNRTEFLVGFWQLAPGWLWLLAPIVGTLAVLGLILPRQWFPRYTAGLFAVGALLWAQGNLLVADYGVLDGSGLDLTSHAWRTPLDTGLWLGVLLAAVVFAVRVVRIAPVASGVLVVLQAIVLVIPMGREATLSDLPAAEPAEADWQLPPPEIYELSSARNLIHIVLDGFPTRTFTNILEADGPAFERDWGGFTLFANHLGAHRHTVATMPAMLSGVSFRNEMPFPEFAARYPSVFNVLGQQGYRLRLLTALPGLLVNPAFPGVDAVTRYDIPNPYGSYGDYVDVARAQLLDLSLFRHAPQALKSDIYRDQQWLLQQQIASRRGPEATAENPYGDVAFLRDFAGRITRGDDAPVYTYLHLLTPHRPVVTDASCRYALRTNPNGADFTNQARCALSAVRGLFHRLHDLGLYDQSAIVVTSDHGIDAALNPPAADHPLRSMRSPARTVLASFEPRATPLLLVKPLGAEGRLEISHAPTSIIDVPTTLLDLAGLPDTLGSGVSVMRIDPAASRQRTYAHAWTFRPTPFFEALYVVAVTGRTDDPSAWSYHRTVFGPTDDRAAQRREHQIGLLADQDATANQPGTRVYRTTDNYAVFYMPPENPRVTFDLRRTPGMATAQTVTVRIDGDIVDQHVLTDDA
ncbi:MAG: sulfatase-like hydrolase/transferase [Acidobacteria bacterium]|nr:sulfatase-like hydrolase/transferase [Acidobacteriota bacterium]